MLWKRLFVAVILGFSLVVPTNSSGAVGQISFTTDEQSVSARAASEKITVQAQDVGGASFSVPETADLYLSTDSGSGEFSSNQANWKTVEMLTVSKNSANRSFYYKDSEEGIHTIRARLVLRESGNEWFATHTIAIGVPLESGGGEGEDGDVESNSDDSSTNTNTDEGQNDSQDDDKETESELQDSSNVQSLMSAHSSPRPIIYAPDTLDFATSAGRERLGVVEAPLTFFAEGRLNGVPIGRGATYTWSFGDGGSAVGKKVEHSYRYPGRYQIVLNAEYADVSAVARTVANIAPGKIIISTVTGGDSEDGAVVLINQANEEVNLGGWVLSLSGSSMTFPQDTILMSKHKLHTPLQYFTPSVSNLAGYVTLYYPSRVVADTFLIVADGIAQDLEAEPTLAVLKEELNRATVMVDELSTAIHASSVARRQAKTSAIGRAVSEVARPPLVVAQIVAPRVQENVNLVQVAAARETTPPHPVSTDIEGVTSQLKDGAEAALVVPSGADIVIPKRQGLFASLLARLGVLDLSRNSRLAR